MKQSLNEKYSNKYDKQSFEYRVTECQVASRGLECSNKL